MSYCLTKPCNDCPFRNDGKGVKLRKSRIAEIARSMVRSEFPCHKTTSFNEDTGDVIEHSQTHHCAGALIFLEKLERPSQMMRIAERLGMYDRTKLAMDAPVWDSLDEWIEEGSI